MTSPTARSAARDDKKERVVVKRGRLLQDRVVVGRRRRRLLLRQRRLLWQPPSLHNYSPLFVIPRACDFFDFAQKRMLSTKRAVSMERPPRRPTTALSFGSGLLLTTTLSFLSSRA
jgi:hypothetical protein